MTFPTEVTDHSKGNYIQKCVYLVSMLKDKNPSLYESYKGKLEHLKAEESWALYQELLAVLQGLPAPVVAPKAVKPTAPIKKAVKPEPKKVEKKEVKKEVKKEAKKEEKKPVKKEEPKKAVKKVAKKAPAKKAAPKKAVKKAAPKKAAAKKAPAKKAAKKKR